MAGCKILIVDDDAEDVEFISQALKEIGEVLIQHVNTTKKAYQYLDETDSLPQLIIVDMYLLDAMGASFLSELITHETYKKIKAVIFSSASSAYAVKMYPDLEVDFLQKPNDIEGYNMIAEQIWKKLLDCPSYSKG